MKTSRENISFQNSPSNMLREQVRENELQIHRFVSLEKISSLMSQHACTSIGDSNGNGGCCSEIAMASSCASRTV